MVAVNDRVVCGWRCVACLASAGVGIIRLGYAPGGRSNHRCIAGDCRGALVGYAEGKFEMSRLIKFIFVFSALLCGPCVTSSLSAELFEDAVVAKGKGLVIK